MLLPPCPIFNVHSIFSLRKDMVPMSESPEERLNLPPGNSISVEYAVPWIDYAIEQARLFQKDTEHRYNSFTEAAKSRLSEFRATGSAHFGQTIESLRDVKSKYDVYEDMAFGKIKEGIDIAASHPALTAGVVTGSSLFLLKRPRRFLYYKTIRLFLSEESMLSRADAKVKELRQSIDLLKADSQKLERRARLAEEEITRGRTKLRQAGKHIQSQIRSVYKIERKAAGLKDIVTELPRREASQFRSQVSKLASEAKRERNDLKKEVSKISNYGISV